MASYFGLVNEQCSNIEEIPRRMSNASIVCPTDPLMVNLRCMEIRAEAQGLIAEEHNPM